MDSSVYVRRLHIRAVVDSLHNNRSTWTLFSVRALGVRRPTLIQSIFHVKGTFYSVRPHTNYGRRGRVINSSVSEQAGLT